MPTPVTSCLPPRLLLEHRHRPGSHAIARPALCAGCDQPRDDRPVLSPRGRRAKQERGDRHGVRTRGEQCSWRRQPIRANVHALGATSASAYLARAHCHAARRGPPRAATRGTAKDEEGRAFSLLACSWTETVGACVLVRSASGCFRE